jgi:oligopeptide/dipeptide ABC transporter ATP-binding protein
MTVGHQIAETVMLHQKANKDIAWKKAVSLLDKVGIPHPDRRAHDYPHQFSGGMRQRAMIAIALSCEPDILIADEPTTALDVTIQAQILDLLKVLQREYGMAIVLITHNIGVVAEMADDVVVMYAGRPVEISPVQKLFSQPRHPYTQGLLASVPSLFEKKDRLDAIPGQPPDVASGFTGCPFSPRCHAVMPRCKADDPPPFFYDDGRMSNCWKADDAKS